MNSLSDSTFLAPTVSRQPGRWVGWGAAGTLILWLGCYAPVTGQTPAARSGWSAQAADSVRAPIDYPNFNPRYQPPVSQLGRPPIASPQAPTLVPTATDPGSGIPASGVRPAVFEQAHVTNPPARPLGSGAGPGPASGVRPAAFDEGYAADPPAPAPALDAGTYPRIDENGEAHPAEFYPAQPGWWEYFDVYGHVRVRQETSFERNTGPTRNRQRLRARLGMRFTPVEEWEAGLRMTTGDRRTTLSVDDR